MVNKIKLGVNVDHVATLREARKGLVPNVLIAAKEAIAAGADSITVHLREDRRHIQDSDVLLLKGNVPINLELAATDEMIDFATSLNPEWCCIVPERREELTTEGGLAIESQIDSLTKKVKMLQNVNIKVSVFIDASLSSIKAAKQCGVDAVEIHTGILERYPTEHEKCLEFLESLRDVSQWGHENNLRIHAGHGLDYTNIKDIISIPHIQEVNIGHSIISRAIFTGLYNAVREMVVLIQK